MGTMGGPTLPTQVGTTRDQGGSTLHIQVGTTRDQGGPTLPTPLGTKGGPNLILGPMGAVVMGPEAANY